MKQPHHYLPPLLRITITLALQTAQENTGLNYSRPPIHNVLLAMAMAAALVSGRGLKYGVVCSATLICVIAATVEAIKHLHQRYLNLLPPKMKMDQAV